MADTGIILRRNNKSHFTAQGNEVIEGEVVFALDTQELGMLKDGELIWVPFDGVVKSVNGKQGVVILARSDIAGLEYVDNTSDLNKPVSNAVRELFEDHLNAENPHEITKYLIGLENVDNTADLDKPIPNSVRNELKQYISFDYAKKQTPDGVIHFTDTLYSIKDGELSENNFSAFYKAFIDNFETNARVLPPEGALFSDGEKIGLRRADGSFEEVTIPSPTGYDDTALKNRVTALEERQNVGITVIDNLYSSSKDYPLSANQGKILNTSLIKANEQINANKVKVAEVSSKVVTAASKADTAISRVNTMQTRLNSIDFNSFETKENARATKNDLQTAINAIDTKLNSNIANLSHNISENLAKINQNKTDITSANTNIANLTSKQTTLENSIASINNEIKLIRDSLRVETFLDNNEDTYKDLYNLANKSTYTETSTDYVAKQTRNLGAFTKLDATLDIKAKTGSKYLICYDTSDAGEKTFNDSDYDALTAAAYNKLLAVAEITVSSGSITDVKIFELPLIENRIRLKVESGVLKPFIEMNSKDKTSYCEAIKQLLGI